MKPVGFIRAGSRVARNLSLFTRARLVIAVLLCCQAPRQCRGRDTVHRRFGSSVWRGSGVSPRLPQPVWLRQLGLLSATCRQARLPP